MRPSPIALLARRLFRELDEKQSAFDLPSRRFVRGATDLDLSATMGRERVAIPFGPAAGPHTQLAQNIVLSWLAGGRAIELKTVQQDDHVVVPRPCIDMREAGFNCESSQELTVEEALREYVKGALLIAMVQDSGKSGVPRAFGATAFEASVGYDLHGIRSRKVERYLDQLRDVSGIVRELLAELPADLRRYADGAPLRALARSVTLSTFHGCPPNEIEAIAAHLMDRHGLSVTVKLNPTLLGEADLRRLLEDHLGYADVRVPPSAFLRDPTFDDAMEMARRLRDRAKDRGVRFGVKLTNTLVTTNDRAHLARSAPEAYLSGPPLHVLAAVLVGRVREAIGADVPMSFSAGIDAHNAADAIALDLVPVTVCTDWLKTGGYGRGIRIFEAIADRVRRAGAATRRTFILRAFGHAETSLAAIGVSGPDRDRALAALDLGRDADSAIAGALGAETADRWAREAALRNTASYVDRALAEPRYRRDHNDRPPKKVGSRLTTFDCLTCDKCVAVCPNDAIFTYVAPRLEVPASIVRAEGERLTATRTGTLPIEERHQIASFADHCNDCGNCDTFCPEDGGPFAAKPRLFGSLEALRQDPRAEGLFVARTSRGFRVWVKHPAAPEPETQIVAVGSVVTWRGESFEISFDLRDPVSTVRGRIAEGAAVDLTIAEVACTIAASVLAAREVNLVTAMEVVP